MQRIQTTAELHFQGVGFREHGNGTDPCLHLSRDSKAVQAIPTASHAVRQGAVSDSENLLTLVLDLGPSCCIQSFQKLKSHVASVAQTPQALDSIPRLLGSAVSMRAC